MKWIELEAVLENHNSVIESTGGSYGVRIKMYTHFVPSLEGEAANTFDKIIDKGEDIFVRSHDEVAELVDQIVDES